MDETIDSLKGAAAEILHDRGILAAYVFGSRAKGTARPDSDVDVGYYMLPGHQPLSGREELELAARLGDRISHEVDFRGLDRAPLDVRGRIAEESIRIYSRDEPARVRLEADLLSRYHDYKSDEPRVERLLDRVRQYHQELGRLGSLGPDEFLDDPDKVGSAKYHFVVVIEAAIDLANHVVASEGLRVPRDNAGSFAVLVEAGILPKKRQARFRRMAAFRNRLVHVYWDVDDRLVYDSLHDSLDDLDAFAAAIARLT